MQNAGEETAAQAQEAQTDPSAEFIAAVNANNPDVQVTTPEEAMAEATKIITEAIQFRQRTSAINERISAAIEAEAEFGEMLKLVFEGAPLRAAIAAVMDPEDLTPQEGDDDMESWKKASEERTKKRSEREAYDKEFNSNMEMSRSEWEKFKADNNVSEEEAEALLAEVESVANDMFSGKISGKMLGMVHKGMNFSKAVEDAAAAGKAEGAAAQITTTKEHVGDGMPDNTGVSGEEGVALTSPKSKIAQRLDEMTRKKEYF